MELVVILCVGLCVGGVWGCGVGVYAEAMKKWIGNGCCISFGDLTLMMFMLFV